VSSVAGKIVRDILDLNPFEPRESEIHGLEHAYRVQAEVTALLLSQVPDRRVAGYKIAFNRRSSLEYYGLSEPCYAPLFSDQIHASGAALPIAQFRDLVVEPEIAVRLRSSLRGDENRTAVAAAIAGLCPAIEVMDLRGALARDPSAAAAVAQRVHSEGAVIAVESPGEAPDVADVVARLSIDGIELGAAHSSAPQTPLDAIAWLALCLAAQGLALEAGMYILTGALLPGSPVKQPGQLVATMEPLGSVSVTLV
jgi:2-keto-4-pentenoate hydratase